MNLAENDRHVKTEMKTKKVLNIFSSNNYIIFDPTLKALVKCKKHPSIFTIQPNFKGKNKLFFHKNKYTGH